MNQKEIPSSSGWVISVRLTPPQLKDNTADAERLISGLKA
jgi:hypothetical protein